MEFTKEAAMECYQEHVFTRNLVMGIVFKGNVYAVFGNDVMIEKYIKLDIASDKKTNVLRFYFKDNLQRKALINKNAVVVGTTEDLDAIMTQYKKDKINRGYAFECMIAKWFGVEWEPNNHTPLWEGADITDKLGRHWMVKLETGTIITETTFKTLQGI